MSGDLGRNWQAAMVAAALILMPSLGAAAETRVFRVLIAPGEGVPSGAFSRSPDLAAALNQQPYAVRSVEPLRPGEGRTFIVLDFGMSRPENHACLLAEALSACNRMHSNPPPIFIAAGDTQAKLHVDFGQGREINVLLRQDLKALISECEAWRSIELPSPASFLLIPTPPGTLHPLRLPEGISGKLVSIVVLDRLRSGFSSKDAPVRVFWLSEDFRQFVNWKYSGCADCDSFFTRGPEAQPRPSFVDIEKVAEADLTVFPIIFGSRKGGHLLSPTQAHLKQAGIAAEMMGGFASTVSGAPGETLARAADRVREGVVVTLEGPITANGQHPAKARTLEIKARGSQSFSWRRRFVVNREGSVESSPPQGAALEPLIVPSTELGLQYGCETAGSPRYGHGLALTLPPAVVAAPSGKVDVYVDFPEEAGLARQRETLTRTQGQAEGLCLPLMHARDGIKFWLVAMDRQTGWVGAKAGQLSSSNPER